METKRVDLEVTKYGEFKFAENANGNYSVVKFPFTKDCMQTTTDVAKFLNDGSPEGFKFEVVADDRIEFITPIGDKMMNITFTKRGVRFYGKKPCRYSYYKSLPQVAIDFSPTEVKVLTVFQKLYKGFWSEEFILNKVADVLNIDAEDIYLESNHWGKRTYIVNHDTAIEVETATMKYKVVGLLFDDDDAGRRWIETVESINGEIESLTNKRDRLLTLQEKLNN